MALIDCPECGHKVSDQADACPSCGRRLTDRLAKLELETELNRIDLEWERERQKYMVKKGKWGGGLKVPTKADALVGFVVGVILLGILIYTFPFNIVRAHGELFWRGVFVSIFLLAILPVTAYFYWKALEYERAEADYRRKREEVKAKYGRTNEDQRDESSPASG